MTNRTPQLATPLGTQVTEALVGAVAKVVLGSAPESLQAALDALGLLGLLQPLAADPAGTPPADGPQQWDPGEGREPRGGEHSVGEPRGVGLVGKHLADRSRQERPGVGEQGLPGGDPHTRSLVLPTQDRVRNFPLVAWVLGPAGAPSSGDLGAALSGLTTPVNWIPPQRGEYWAAVGVRWTTFDLLKGFVLLTVAFGTDIEIGLIGILSLSVPREEPLGYAELDLLVSFRAASGVLTASAALSPASYVLDKNCHLTGGFAFTSWFRDQPAPGARAGDFVVTLGCYHPAYHPPDYYPPEPRVGFNWHLGDALAIQGGLYFALTPSAVMAGGSLSATFEAGPLKAWFDAWADFLMEWKPFHFDVDIGIDVGASCRVDALFVHTTFTVELGASLHLWGPPIGGFRTPWTRARSPGKAIAPATP
ncbi:MAG TPA: DUF6603 domain-containing protein [Gemmataceae bacterium]